MKTILTMILMMSALVAGATHQNSELLLSSANNDPIFVTLDNQVYRQPDNEFEIPGLAPGNHYLVVSKVAYRHGSHVPVSRVMYRGNIFLPAASRVTAIVENGFQLEITGVEAIENFHWTSPVDPWVLHPAPVVNHCEAPLPMDCNSFEQLKSSIECKTFESSKLLVARQAGASNYFTSSQVTELLSLFTFESTKLEFAKFAYSRTLDKQQYFKVNDAFTFESSMDELNAFILNRS